MVIDFGDLADCFEIFGHYGEGLFEAVLAIAEGLEGLVAGGVADEVEASYAFCGYDFRFG